MKNTELKKSIKMKELSAGIGEIEIGGEDIVLAALGLGSCVGVALYDPIKKIGGLAHIMLPDSKEHTRSLPERNVLIAETNEKDSLLIKNILAKNNVEIIAETKEKNALLSNFKKLKPNVIFLSTNLPPENGLVAIQNILDFDKKAKTIILSPELNIKKIYEYLEQGAIEVLFHPYTEEKILSVFEYALYENLRKFADKAIPFLIERMVNRGARREKLVAKIAGGAHMFKTITDEEIMKIGTRNIAKVKEVLKEKNIKLLSEDTGDFFGRTIKFNVDTGVMQVKSKNGIKEI